MSILLLILVITFVILTIVLAFVQYKKRNKKQTKYEDNTEDERVPKKKPAKPTSISIPWLGTALRWALGLALIFFAIWFFWDNRFSFMPEKSCAEKTTTVRDSVKVYDQQKAWTFSSKTKEYPIFGLERTYELEIIEGTLEGHDGLGYPVTIGEGPVLLNGDRYATLYLKVKRGSRVTFIAKFYHYKYFERKV